MAIFSAQVHGSPGRYWDRDGMIESRDARSWRESLCKTPHPVIASEQTTLLLLPADAATATARAAAANVAAAAVT